MRNNIIISIIFFILVFQVQAQNNDVFTVVEKMPKYTGDIEQLKKILGSEIECLSKGITHYFKFIVEPNGKISDIDLLNTNLDQNKVCRSQIDKAFESKMLVWEPGMQNGKAVRVYINLKIKK